MLFTEQIQRLKSKKETVRSSFECEKIERKILKLAKKYNELNRFDRYLIIDNTVYGLEINPDYSL